MISPKQIVNKPPDTTERLWDYLYRVSVPYLRSRTIEDLRNTGTVVSGIASYDKDIPNQMQTMHMSVNSMVDYFREGVPVRVLDPRDTKQIYEDISSHIHAWKTRLEKGINIGDAPIDDLITMDRFANSVYAHAKYQFTSDIAQSIFAQHLNNVQRINASNFFTMKATQKLLGKPGEEDVFRINADPEPEVERDSLGEFFKSRLTNMKRF